MGLILILAWMYSTSELDELFQILNLIEKDLNLKELEPHWSNTTLNTRMNSPDVLLHEAASHGFYDRINVCLCLYLFTESYIVADAII